MAIVIVGAILLIGLFIFAKSAAREANRIMTEADFRLEGVNARAQSVNCLLDDDEIASEAHERKASILKARAEEVASRQAPLWRGVSKVARSRSK